MCCCLRGPKWRQGVAAAGTVSRVNSAFGVGASHGAVVAAVVGVEVVVIGGGGGGHRGGAGGGVDL